MAIGQALLAAGDGGMTAAEMGLLAGQDQSNLKKVAEELVREGVLRYTDPPSLNGRRGRRPRDAYAFADGEQQRLEELVGEERSFGVLGVGTQVVIVDAEQDPERLSEVLLRSDLTENLAWAAHVDRGRSEVWLAYEGHEASDDSRDLMTAFRIAELSARRASVMKLVGARDLAPSMERSRRRAEGTRAQFQARRPNPELGF
jgi:hypothetical protein